MGYPTKIATCCHCGSKAALRLGKGRHELACASCGAPLHNLKMLPVRPVAKPAISHAPAPRAAKSLPLPKGERQEVRRIDKKSYKKRKKRKGWIGKRLADWAEDVFDAVEDIFD